jgi:hypothetical protein
VSIIIVLSILVYSLILVVQTVSREKFNVISSTFKKDLQSPSQADYKLTLNKDNFDIAFSPFIGGGGPQWDP